MGSVGDPGTDRAVKTAKRMPRPLKRVRKVSVYAGIVVVLVAAVMLMSTAVALGQPTWTETRPAGDDNRDWQTTAISGDGMTMLAGADFSRLYLSTDGGATWTETQPAGDDDHYWQTTVISKNGMTMLAGAHGSGLHLSADGGTNWDEVDLPGSDDYDFMPSAAMSADGTTMLVGDSGGRLYYSSDGGGSWEEARPAGDVDRNWMAIAMSADGETMLAGSFGGRLYYSIDGGRAWTEARPAGDVDRNWMATAMSEDGKTMLAGGRWGTDLYRSIDRGTTWTDVRPTGELSRDWLSAAMSTDGKTMLAGGSADRLYCSIDGADTWIDARPTGGGSRHWWTTAMSEDGKTMLAGVSGGRLYLAKIPYTLTYTAGKGGTIQGEALQSIERGADGTAVTASADPGYRFTRWSDGRRSPERQDLGVTEDLSFTAFFAPIAPNKPDPPSPAPSDRWTDISDERWEEVYGITLAEAARVAEGYPDGTFRPNLPVTRSQSAKMILGGFSLPTFEPLTPSFPDVPRIHQFYPWIEGAQVAQVIQGFADGTFRPDEKTTREQSASMLGRVLIREEMTTRGYIQGSKGTYPTLDEWFSSEGETLLAGFADAEGIAIGHRASTAYLLHKGVLVGRAQGDLTYMDPGASLTRAQATAMIARAAKVGGGG
jgi:photosystem II stability/assembly factor-like uncharacterized protein